MLMKRGSNCRVDRILKLRKMQWLQHAAHMMEMKNAYKNLRWKT
jgi:hypothetical protein